MRTLWKGTFFAALCAAITVLSDVAHADNLLRNGGFEKGQSGWMWEQWAGKKLPGYIDREDMAGGLASFKMTLTEDQGERWMAIETTLESADRPHVLRFSLKPDRVPADAARVRFQMVGKGWLGNEQGQLDLLKTGGTSNDWSVYQYRLSAEKLDGAAKVRIFFYHSRIGTGTLGIDDVVLRPAKQNERTRLPDPPATAAPADKDTQTRQPVDRNLLENGGFESGLDLWMYQQWTGKPAPGRIVK